MLELNNSPFEQEALKRLIAAGAQPVQHQLYSQQLAVMALLELTDQWAEADDLALVLGQMGWETYHHLLTRAGEDSPDTLPEDPTTAGRMLAEHLELELQ